MHRPLMWLVKLILTGAILAAIAWNLDLHRITHTLSSAPLAAIGAGLAISFLQMALSAKRLSIVIAMFGRLVALRDALRVTLEGMFFSQTFVSFLGGDAQRVWQIHKCGFSLKDAALVIALDRFISLLANHLFVLVCTPYLLLTVASNSIRTGLLVVAGGGFAAIAIVLAIGFMRGRLKFRVLNRLQTNRIVRSLFEIFTVGRHLFILDARVLSALAISLAVAMANGLIFFLILLAWNIPTLQAFGCALLVPAIMEIAMLPISVAGWGVREGAVIFAFGSLGVSAEIAFGSSIAYALIALTIGMMGGLLWLFDRRKIGTLVALEIDPDTRTKKNRVQLHAECRKLHAKLGPMEL